MKIGFLEQFNVKRISGWIRKDLADNDIIIRINDHQFICKANIYREDLESNGLGFSFEIPSNSINSNKNHNVTVILDGSGEIPNSPQVSIADRKEKEKVLHGKDGWLFLHNDSNKTLDHLTGQLKIEESTLKSWLDILKSRCNFFSEKNKKFIHFICPEKEVVYCEQLPRNIKISEERPINMILTKLDDNTHSKIIYPDLSNDKYLTYTKGDTHWSYHGAYEGFLNIIDKLNILGASINYYDIDRYSFTTEYQASDLLIKTDSTNIEPIKFTKSITDAKCIFSNDFKTSGRVQIFNNVQALNNKRIYILHTSSIDWMKPYLNDSFREIKYVWGRNLDLTEDYSKYDIIITQNNERFLNEAPVS